MFESSIIQKIAFENSVTFEQSTDEDKIKVYVLSIDYMEKQLDLMDKVEITIDDIDILIGDLRQIITTLSNLRKKIRDELHQLINIDKSHAELDSFLFRIDEALFKVRYALDEIYTASDMFDVGKNRDFRNCFSNFQKHLAQVFLAFVPIQVNIHRTNEQNQQLLSRVILSSKSYPLQQPNILGRNTMANISDQGLHQKSPSVPVRWLHLSDFHVGKDDYGQRQLFKYILKNVQDKVQAGIRPDIIFISGDIANKGKTTEYKTFFHDFFIPLVTLLGDEMQKRIYLIPGNHDVDRSKAAAVQRYGVLSKVPQFLDPTKQGLNERRPLFPRFQAYAKSMIHQHTAVDSQWLFSPAGAYTATIEFPGHRLGILGLNTAWLSEGDADQHQLMPGKAILETGLRKLSECDTRIVLGHHPIDWFLEEEIQPIRALLGKSNVIYLHGHLHKNSASQQMGAGYPFPAIQAGASFQAREHELWVNRILWCDFYPSERQISAEPLQWSRENQEWAIDGMAFPEKFRQRDRWILPLP